MSNNEYGSACFGSLFKFEVKPLKLSVADECVFKSPLVRTYNKESITIYHIFVMCTVLVILTFVKFIHKFKEASGALTIFVKTNVVVTCAHNEVSCIETVNAVINSVEFFLETVFCNVTCNDKSIKFNLRIHNILRERNKIFFSFRHDVRNLGITCYYKIKNGRGIHSSECIVS